MYPKIGWVLGSAAVLFLIIADGFALFSQQGAERDDMATALLVLFLATWSYVLGLAGLAFFLVWWLMGRRRMRASQADMSRYSAAEPQRRHLEMPEMEDLRLLQQDEISQDETSVVPSRWSRRNKEQNEADSARVA